jgi:hypothetical protein
MHYRRVYVAERRKRAGLPPTPPRPSKAERFWAKVDKGDEHDCWEWTAFRDPDGYGRLDSGPAHRYSYKLAVGPIPQGMFIDHRCRNRGCVNPSHLRLATNKQNSENQGGPPSTNTSGYRGVSWDTRRQCWVAQVGHERRRIHVGYYSTAEAAAEAARLKRIELFTHNDADRVA